jgi:hypothetical protein
MAENFSLFRKAFGDFLRTRERDVNIIYGVEVLQG